MAGPGADALAEYASAMVTQRTMCSMVAVLLVVAGACGSDDDAMLYTRGHRRDYDDWAAAGCTGWGWDDVLPWFRRAENNERGADDCRCRSTSSSR